MSFRHTSSSSSFDSISTLSLYSDVDKSSRASTPTTAPYSTSTPSTSTRSSSISTSFFPVCTHAHIHTSTPLCSGLANAKMAEEMDELDKLDETYRLEERRGSGNSLGCALDMGRVRDSLELERNRKVIGCGARRKLRCGVGVKARWESFRRWCRCWGRGLVIGWRGFGSEH